jgi:hypothetical protein
MSLPICIEPLCTAGSGTQKKLALLAVAMTLSVTTAQPFAMGSEVSSKATGGKVASATAGSSMQMDDIQDVAFTLQRIRQQAINVYVEATRKKVQHYELNIPSLSSMPTAPLEDQSAYLPLRKGWLVFFIGTMEPLVQILNEHLKRLDERTAQSGMPSQYLPEWQGIVKDWKSAIQGLNDQLNVCASLVDDSSSGNVEVAKAAKSIDSQISALDNVLQKASNFLQDKMPKS